MNFLLATFLMLMNINQLNTDYGAPGRIVFRDGFAGYPNVVIANKYGSAEIALLGANVLSYRPTGQSEVVFRSSKKDGEYNRGEKVHVGIPLCWPMFGIMLDKSLPQHGFARLMIFEVRGTEYSEEKTEITLGLKSNEETKKLWPHDFDLELKISVSMKLNLTVTTKNTGKDDFTFSCGFHPYFRVRERNEVKVAGVKGLTCVASANGERWEGERKEDFAFTVAPDDVFTFPKPTDGAAMVRPHEAVVLDPGLKRAIALVYTGGDNLVIWNSGEEQISDHTAEDWRRFVCVEPVSDWPGGRTLKPGESHTLTAAIQSTLESAPNF